MRYHAKMGVIILQDAAVFVGVGSQIEPVRDGITNHNETGRLAAIDGEGNIVERDRSAFGIDIDARNRRLFML